MSCFPWALLAVSQTLQYTAIAATHPLVVAIRRGHGGDPLRGCSGVQGIRSGYFLNHAEVHDAVDVH
eukprot:238182-Amphidinium_carterae.1